MKVSVYSTVLNEESSIVPLLDSLISQTRKPDEIVVVDGGSKDKTVDIVREYEKADKSIKLIISKGSNVAQGRNTGIQNSRYDIIASIDGGCIADKNWLQNLIKNFETDIDIASGICIPDVKNTFEECFAELLYPKIDEWKAYWPSHQNIAFRKTVWEKINYPEWCYRSEDTWFNLKANEEGFKFCLEKDAIIYWRPRKNLKEVFKNSYLWAKSNIENDVRADVTTKLALNYIRLLIWRLSGLLLLIIVFVFISGWSAILLSPFILKDIINLYYKEKKISIIRIIYKNLIFYTDILANILGFMAGKIAMKNKKSNLKEALLL